MEFRATVNGDRVHFCVPQTMNDDTEVQIIDCSGTYEAKIPPHGELLVVSVIKYKKEQKPDKIEYFPIV